MENFTKLNLYYKILLFCVFLSNSVSILAQISNKYNGVSEGNTKSMSFYDPNYDCNLDLFNFEDISFHYLSNDPNYQHSLLPSISLNGDILKSTTNLSTSSFLTNSKIKYLETNLSNKTFRNITFNYSSDAIALWNGNSESEPSNCYITGALLNAVQQKKSGNYYPGAGLIKKFSIDNSINLDIHTRCLDGTKSNPILHSTSRTQDVILKVIESGEYLYACGYSINQGFSFAGMIGIIYKIPKDYINNGTTCNNCSDISLYSYGSFICDIQDINGEIYFVGNNFIYTMIGNLNQGIVRNDLFSFDNCINVQNESFFTRLKYNPNIDKIECIFNDHSTFGFGIVSYDLNLSSADYKTITSVNLQNNLIPPTIYIKDFEYDDNYNMIIDGYLNLPTPTGGHLPYKLIMATDRVKFTGTLLKPSTNYGVLNSKQLLSLPAKMPTPMQEQLVYKKENNKVFTTESWDDMEQTYIYEFEYDPSSSKFTKLSDQCPQTLPVDGIFKQGSLCNSFNDDINELPFIVEHVAYFDYSQSYDMDYEYPMHCGDNTESNLSKCQYWEKDIIYKSTFQSSTNPPSKTLCPGEVVKLGAIQKSFFGESSIEWYREDQNGVKSLINSNCLTIDVNQKGIYSFVGTRSQWDGTQCQFESNPITIYELDDELKFTNSNEICQGESVKVELKDNTPNTSVLNYHWTKSGNTISASSTVNLKENGQYVLHTQYDNGCLKDYPFEVKYKGITVSQTISETGSSNEKLTFRVCNNSANAIYNLKIKTDLNSNNIDYLNSPGWVLNGTMYEYTIASIPARTSSTQPYCIDIDMNVKVNKCKSTNDVIIDIKDPNYSCSKITNTATFWENTLPVNLTLNSNVPFSCDNNPVTFNLSTSSVITNPVYAWLKDGNIITGANSSTYTESNGSPVSSHTYKATVEYNQCKVESNLKNIQFSVTPTLSANIVHLTCNPIVKGSIDLSVSPSNLSYTYDWKYNNSTIANTQDLSNLTPISSNQYTVKVTNSTGCSASSSYTINNNSQIAINFSQKLIDCSTNKFSFTALVTNGIEPYTYQWTDLSNTNPNNGSPSNPTPNTYNQCFNDGNQLRLLVTDATGCRKEFIYTIKPNISAQTAFNSTQTIFNNENLIIDGSVNLNKEVTLNNCNLVFKNNVCSLTGMPNLKITAPANTSLYAGISMNNSEVYSCSDKLAKGIELTSDRTYLYPRNCTFSDMFAAIEVTQNVSGHVGLPLMFNTFKNNHIGIKIASKNASINTKGTKPFPGAPLPNYKGWSNLTFEGSSSIKSLCSSTIYNSIMALNSINNSLEKTTYSGTSMGSYAGIVSYFDNTTKGLYLSTLNIILNPDIATNSFKNMSNGILVENGLNKVANSKFENINLSSSTLPFKFNGNAIYNTGSANTNNKLAVLNTTSNEFTNCITDINTTDVNLALDFITFVNTQQNSVKSTRISTAAITNSITNCDITAREPIVIQAKSNDIINISNNKIKDINTLSNLNSIISIAGSGNLANNTSNKIDGNTISIYNSKKGISISGIGGNSATNRFLISNNNIQIFNNHTNNFTFAGITMDNTNNYNLLNNTIFMDFYSYTQLNTAIGNLITPTTTATNACPIGITTNSVNSLTLQCNNLYTQSGTFHQNTHLNFDLITNNYATPRYGMLFYNYPSSNSVIRGMSNKFYCNLANNLNDFIKNLSGNNSLYKPYVGFLTKQKTPFPTNCFYAVRPNCESNPPITLPYSFYPGVISSDFQIVSNGTLPNDNNCPLYCTLPKIAQDLPEIKSSLPIDCILYPNPNQGSFNINLLNLPEEIDAARLTIYSMDGRQLFLKDMDIVNSKLEIQTQLSDGQYIVKIENSQYKLVLTKNLVISNK